MKFLNILKKIISFKLIFTKPNKKKVLVYDRDCERIYNKLFPKKYYEILDVRYESINLYVILQTLTKYGLKNFKDNYKKCFIDLVSPKIVLTAIDNNPAFYDLKNINNKPYYVSFQYGMRDNKFYEKCKKFIKKTGRKLKSDYIFLFGKNEKKRFSKIIDGSIFTYGNVANNYFHVKKGQLKKKISSMVYISMYNLSRDTFSEDKKIFNFLVEFCKRKKIKLSYCAKFGSSKENFIRENLSKGDWSYLPRVSPIETYNNLNKHEIVVFTYSSLGFEALSKGMRCAAFYKSFPIEGNYVKYPKSGFFWSEGKNNLEMEKILNRVINTSKKNWKKVVRKYSSEIMEYDPKNKKIKKILKNILKKRIGTN